MKEREEVGGPERSVAVNSDVSAIIRLDLLGRRLL